MNQTPLDIRVIYSADKKRRPTSVPRPPRKISEEPKREVLPAATRAKAPLLLPLFNLLLVAGFSYFTWWPVDQYMTVEVFMLQVPVPGVEIDMDRAAAEIFGIVPEKPLPNDAEPAAQMPEEPQAKYQGQTAAVVIGAAGIGWLTLSTIAGCILAWACGAGLGARAPNGVRTMCFVFAIALIVLLVAAWFAVISKYGRGYPTDFLRGWMGALAVLFLFWGIARGRSAGSLFRAGSVAMLLSAAGAVVGLYLWSQCGVRVDMKELGMIGCGFVAVQWLYALALWPIARRF